MKKYVVVILCFHFNLLLAQEIPGKEEPAEVLTFQEYLGLVKQFHPVVSQAGLKLSIGEAGLLRARGGFDPKIEVDYDRKQFKGTEYYDILNSTFKIPTWYGVEFKASYDQNTGMYLNPERTVPEEGLFSAGVSVDIGRGMFISDRMAALRSARAFRDQSIAEREILVNEVIYEASLAYFDWLEVYNEMRIYENFLENALERYRGISTNARLGEIAAIDTVEAKISVQNRTLELEQARVKLMKERLNLSTYLWLENNIPVELQPNVIPDTELPGKVDEVLELPENAFINFDWENHPKLRALGFKRRALEIDRQLKANKLLPDVNLEYNFIPPDPESFQNFNYDNYKAGISFRFPLFLRKERGDLKIAEFKIQDADFDIELNEVQIENKVEAVARELESFEFQNEVAEEMVENYRILLLAEERRMSFGESSLFLINTRETKYIEALLKRNELLVKYLNAKAELFQTLGLIPEINKQGVLAE